MEEAEGTDTRHRIKTIPHSRNTMGMIEEEEGACRHQEEAEEGDLYRDRLHLMAIEDRPCKDRPLLMDQEVAMTREGVGKAEGIQTVVQ